MIRHICKQLWNKRRSNTWIMLELVLVTFFMWGVIDPVYVLFSNKAIDKGYDLDNVFLLTLGEYPSNHSKFDQEQRTDSLRKINFMRIYRLVQQYPGIESSVVTVNNQYPLSNSMSSHAIKRDSLEIGVLLMAFYQDGDFFKVFRMRDVYTGTIPDHHHSATPTVYLTQDAAGKLFPTGNPVGKEVHMGDSAHAFTVAGVMPGFKFQSTDQPQPTNFMPLDNFSLQEFPWTAQICFRVRDGISKQVFAEEFKQKLAPQMAIGNLYFLKLADFDTLLVNSEFQHGVTNKLRLQISLAIFFLICTFLGIAGTFWLRGDARKSEIGLRMALGGSRSHILKEFLLESWLLTTIAWVVGVLLVLQRIFYTGFAEAPQYPNDIYIQNRFVPHFLIVSFIVYTLMLLITIVGTWIPATRAASTLPSDALHDE